MSEEKVLTLRGKKAVWAPGGGSGPIDPKRLPEGYPYKKQSEEVIFEKQTLTFQEHGGLVLAQTTAIPVEMGKEYIVSFDGETYRCTTFAMTSLAGGEIIAAGNTGAFGAEGTVDTGEPFLIAFANRVTEVYCFVAGETHELQISVMAETIHPMAPEFLPAGVGGNNREFIIDVGDGFSSATTYADVLAAIKAGKCPIAYWNAGGSLLKSYGYMVSEADGAVGFVFFHAGSQIGIAVTESGWGAQ